MIPLFKVFMPKSVKKPLLKTLFSGYIGQGPQVEKFENALKKGISTIEKNLARQVSKAKLTQEQADGIMKKITGTSDYNTGKDADFVVEAVIGVHIISRVGYIIIVLKHPTTRPLRNLF